MAGWLKQVPRGRTRRSHRAGPCRAASVARSMSTGAAEVSERTWSTVAARGRPPSGASSHPRKARLVSARPPSMTCGGSYDAASPTAVILTRWQIATSWVAGWSRCGTDPMTGFYRDGCSSGPEDRGLHTICAVVTAEFLEHQQSIGNDLSTPMPQYRFPGLAPGDRWCVTARNWLRAYQDGCAAPVVLASTCAHPRRGAPGGPQGARGGCPRRPDGALSGRPTGGGV